METISDQQMREEIIRITNACGTCILITYGLDGYPNARVLEDHNVADDLVFWLATSARTGKVAEIRANHKVGLMYWLADEGKYIHVMAEATIVEDQDIRTEHFREHWYQYWPDGPTSPDYVLIRFDPVEFVVYHSGELGYFPPHWKPGER